MFSFPNEVYSAESYGLSLMLSGGKIKPREYNERAGYGVRVLKDKKLGFAYCEKEENLGNALESAAKISRFSKQSNFSFAPETDYGNIDIYDQKIAGMEVDELKSILDEIRGGAEKYSENTKIILSTEVSSTKLENTMGFSGEYKDTSISVYAEVMDNGGFGYYSNSFTHLPGDYYEMGLHAAELAKKMRKPVKPPAGEYDVIIETEVLEDLVDVLLPSFLGDWKRRGISRLTAEKGKLFFDEKLSIYDDGELRTVSGRPFDGEGTKSERMALVEKGVVRNFAYDRENAALEGVERCGQCGRQEFSNPPGIGLATIEIGGGDVENLRNEYPDAITVYSLHGTHTANRTSGDFGVEINAGAIGKDETAVGGFMLTGNIFNLFKNIKGIEKQAKMSGGFISPRIAFEKLKVVS